MATEFQDQNLEIRLKGELLGDINATAIDGVTVTGTAVNGDVLTAHGPESASWVAGGGGGTPSGPAGGSLAGTYPDPSIAALAVGTAELAANGVTAAKIANATITDTQVAAANKDGAAGTASMRLRALRSVRRLGRRADRRTEGRKPHRDVRNVRREGLRQSGAAAHPAAAATSSAVSGLQSALHAASHWHERRLGPPARSSPLGPRPGDGRQPERSDGRMMSEPPMQQQHTYSVSKEAWVRALSAKGPGRRLTPRERLARRIHNLRRVLARRIDPYGY